jgi:hypothetical protein
VSKKVDPPSVLETSPLRVAGFWITSRRDVVTVTNWYSKLSTAALKLRLVGLRSKPGASRTLTAREPVVATLTPPQSGI